MVDFEGPTYHRDDLLLNERRKRDELKEESKVELYNRLVFAQRGVGEQSSTNRKRTEETRRAREMVCWARVILAV
jgi:hypothetical protein